MRKSARWHRRVSCTSFEAAQVLVALPALLSQGLQNIYAKLKNGYYGLTTMLLMRVKSAEGLTHYAPGEFGLVLGLDRAPEMKTVRRKLCELASRGGTGARAFANRWTEQAPDTLGYLYIDGHVRPYHGRCPRPTCNAGGTDWVCHRTGQRGAVGDDGRRAACPRSWRARRVE